MNITIVAATSRQDAVTAQMAGFYQSVFAELGVQANILDLKDIPSNLLETTLYKKPKLANQEWDRIQDLVSATEKFVFIIPEYNGSFPGILKVWVDALQFPVSFKHKKACMLGIADGTQGSAMAMSHFADVLNYVGVHTMALRPRFIHIGKYVRDGQLQNEEYWQFMRLQAEQFVAF